MSSSGSPWDHLALPRVSQPGILISEKEVTFLKWTANPPLAMPPHAGLPKYSGGRNAPAVTNQTRGLGRCCSLAVSMPPVVLAEWPWGGCFPP